MYLIRISKSKYILRKNLCFIILTERIVYTYSSVYRYLTLTVTHRLHLVS